ncbi:M23 family metallopeptidase [Sphaerisporangium aureirubrum]
MGTDDPPPRSSRWRSPLGGALNVTRAFAPPSLPWLPGHRGTDLAARPGQRVHAAGAGVVRYADRLAGRWVVSIVHLDGLRTTYLPVRPMVRLGQAVSTATVIGVVESHPAHCRATCLHWGLISPERYLDPLLLIGQGRVRLLPHWNLVTDPLGRGSEGP